MTNTKINTDTTSDQATRVLDELEAIHRRYNSPHVDDLFSYLDAIESLLREHGRPPLAPARWESAVAMILDEIDAQQEVA